VAGGVFVFGSDLERWWIWNCQGLRMFEMETVEGYESEKFSIEVGAV
jgi:hypothetical protein